MQVQPYVMYIYFHFPGLLFPIWTVGNGAAQGHSLGKTGQPELRKCVQNHISTWGSVGRTKTRSTCGLWPSSVRRALEGRRVWGSLTKAFPYTVGPGQSFPQELLAACHPLGWALTTHFSFLQPPATTLGLSQTEPGNSETQNQSVGGGPRAWVPIQDAFSPAFHPARAWPPPTWKAALARRTGMLWELPVGTGARAEGKIWGQS